MLKRWLDEDWSELDDVEQELCLAQLRVSGQGSARRRHAEAVQEGNTPDPIDCWDYLQRFGDNPRSPWSPDDWFQKMLDPRIGAYCLAMEREARRLAGREALPTDPEVLTREARQAQHSLDVPEEYSRFNLSLMALNERSGWQMWYEQALDGTIGIGCDEDAFDAVEAGPETRRLIIDNWGDLTEPEQPRILAKMERLGQEAACDRLARGNRSTARLDTFREFLGDLAPCPETMQEHLRLASDPRTSMFCSSLERERRRRLGNPPLGEDVRSLEDRRHRAAEECSAAARAFAREYERMFAAPCNDVDLISIARIMGCAADAASPEAGWSRVEQRCAGDPKLGALVQALKDDQPLRAAGLRYDRALARHVNLLWALNRATEWALFEHLTSANDRVADRASKRHGKA
jgi:hypothetical protein